MNNLVQRKVRKNRVGEKFGKLTVISYAGSRPYYIQKNGNPKYEHFYNCKCECGGTKVSNYRTMVSGYNKTCGNCPKQYGNQHHAWKGHGEIGKEIFNYMEWSAKDRGHEFSITIEEMWNLFLKQDRKCAISGVELIFNQTSKTKHLRTASLDRIDSSKGYILENVQWIHRDINYLKKDLDTQKFVEMCISIAQYQAEINNIVGRQDFDINYLGPKFWKNKIKLD